MQQQYRKDNVAQKQIVEITPELLEQSKQEFVSILEHKKDPSFLAFQQMKIVHKENNQIELFTDMTFNKHFLDDVKDDFHTLLENKFKQPIILSIKVDESLQTEKTLYKQVKTNTEIFSELVQKYPLLKIMKEKLGLYID